MQRRPLEIERLLGWLSIAVGMSALQANDSVFFRNVVGTSVLPFVWICAFIVLGMALIVTTYTVNARCRIVLLLLLGIVWACGLALVMVSGPLGVFGGIAIVVLAYIASTLWVKIYGSHTD